MVGHPWQLLYCTAPRISEGVREWAGGLRWRHKRAAALAPRRSANSINSVTLLQVRVCGLLCAARRVVCGPLFCVHGPRELMKTQLKKFLELFLPLHFSSFHQHTINFAALHCGLAMSNGHNGTE